MAPLEINELKKFFDKCSLYICMRVTIRSSLKHYSLIVFDAFDAPTDVLCQTRVLLNPPGQ